jgi:hypothetical protein
MVTEGTLRTLAQLVKAPGALVTIFQEESEALQVALSPAPLAQSVEAKVGITKAAMSLSTTQSAAYIRIQASKYL